MTPGLAAGTMARHLVMTWPSHVRDDVELGQLVEVTFGKVKVAAKVIHISEMWTIADPLSVFDVVYEIVTVTVFRSDHAATQ